MSGLARTLVGEDLLFLSLFKNVICIKYISLHNTQFYIPFSAWCSPIKGDSQTLYVLLRFLKSEGQIQFSLLFQVYHIFRGTSHNLIIIRGSVILLWGLPLLEATLVPYSVIGKDINYVQGQDNYCGLGGDFRNPGIVPWDRDWTNPGPRDFPV